MAQIVGERRSVHAPDNVCPGGTAADHSLPRRQGENLKHPLVDIIILGFCGVLAGCEDFVEMAEWAKVHEEFFRSFPELPHGIPAHDTFTRVLAMFKPTTLEEVLGPWLLERRGLRGSGVIALAKPCGAPV